MKMIGVGIVALALMLSLVTAVYTPSALAQAEDSLEPYFRSMWAVKRVNVRAGPSTSHEKIGLLDVGEGAVVVARTGEWFKLRSRSGQPMRFVYAPLMVDYHPTRELTIRYDDGAVYRGTVRHGFPHGSGVFTWVDGVRYEGDFVDGIRNGRGVYTWANGGSYDGEWRDGDFHGHGVRIYANGNRYEGDFVKDKRTGRGVFTWPSGSRYEGDFVKNKRTGRGVYTWANGGSYDGEWRDGNFHGHGVRIYANGNRYEGDFVGDKYHGRGVRTWADGRSQEGEWRDGEFVSKTTPSTQPKKRADVSQDASLWGAIATAEPDNTTSNPARFVWNASSRNEAEQNAMKGCNSLDRTYYSDAGHQREAGCYVYRVFSTSFGPGHRCGAYVEGTVHFIGGSFRTFPGTGTGNSIREAERAAIASCRSDTGLGIDCRVRMSYCNDR